MPKYKTIQEVPEEVKERLGEYFTSVGGDTFVISGLPSEVVGAALARYSRAPTGIQLTLINEFLDEDGNPSAEKGSALMDKVLNAFGDESVGELEGAHIGLESISQIGTKFIEDKRIGGSPIEQSTRYCKYDTKDERGRWRYLRPSELEDTPFMPRYEEAMDHAFEVYSDAIVKLSEYFKGIVDRSQFMIEIERDGERVRIGEEALETSEEKKAFRTAYNFTIRCAALDVARCVLPASTLTQLGAFGNGRYFTGLLTSMKSHRLEEARRRGEELEEELKKVIPTYIKRAECNERYLSIDDKMRALELSILPGGSKSEGRVTLVPRNLDNGIEVAAYCIYPYANIPLGRIMEVMGELSEGELQAVFDAYKGLRKSRRDRTGRGLEAGYPYTFELVGTFAEYRDLERHRMLTQQRQMLNCDLGFVLPAEMIEVGLEEAALQVVDAVEGVNDDLREAGFLDVSKYCTLFNHQVRFCMGMNLRELQHFAELRTQPAGHYGYRSMAMEMVRQVVERDPFAETFLEFVDFSDPHNKIARAKEQSRIAGRNLAKGVDGSGDLE